MKEKKSCEIGTRMFIAVNDANNAGLEWQEPDEALYL